MKVLQVGLTDLMGKRFNGTSLHQELLKQGIKSQQCLWDKNTNDRFSWQISPRYSKIFKNILKNLEYSLSIQSLLFPYSWKLLLNKQFQSVDLVHYHIIYPNFFSLLSLPFLTRLKPSVWTFHDPWSLTGHCIHPFRCRRWQIGCGSCPNLKTPFIMNKDNTALMWKIKKYIYNYSRFEVIVASQWMQKFTQKTPILSKHRVHYIPFGVDLNIFKPASSVEAKKRMGIYPKSIVLAFRASLIDFKGFRFIKDVLHKLKSKQRICLLAFDDRTLLDDFRGRYQVINMGWVNDDRILANAYNAADIFLMPSTAEAFGMMAIEAMACGKPVIVFTGTALTETVFAPQGGIAVPCKNSEILVKTIKELITNRNLRKEMGKNARKLAEENYDLKDYVKSHINLYKNVISNRMSYQLDKYI